jgi:hypothetical protein
METILVIALGWTVGSVASAVLLGRWLKARPLVPVRIETDPEEGEPPFSRTRLKGLDEQRDLEDVQPTSGMNTASRSGSGRLRRSSRSA